MLSIWSNGRRTPAILGTVRKQISGSKARVLLVGLLLVALPFFVQSVSKASPPCPCNVFTSNQPATSPGLYSQPGGIEVGFKFKTDQSGYISGIRFYKTVGMAGTHTASLWNNVGQRIAQATFATESAAGWQQVDFSPVAVTANTIYTASVFMADGQYTATPNFFVPSGINNSPLSAPIYGSAADSLGHNEQGVYDASGVSTYPYQGFFGGNYWVDVSYVGSISQTPPHVSAQQPASGATNIPLTDGTISATFDTAMDPSTVTSSSFVVKDSSGQSVSGSVSYDKLTHEATFNTSALWQTGSQYTVTLYGGASASAVTDLQGQSLAVDYSWTFTATVTPLSCPCTIKNRQNPSGSTTYSDNSAGGLELGLKIHPKTSGYITALRFYKPIIATDTTNVGNIWDQNGNKLASAIFDHESDYGWQEARLSTPLAVNGNQLYIISYGLAAPVVYQGTTSALTSMISTPVFAVYPSGDSRNAASGSGNNNTVFSSTAGTYPAGGTVGNDYYVDAVFTLQATDVTPLKPTVVQPTDTSYGVKRDSTVSATFERPLNGSTVNNTTVKMYNAQNNIVAGTAVYNQAKGSIVFTPASTLSYSTKYTVKISGQVADLAGASLGSEYSWSFTTGGPISPDMNQGNGGPILLITTNASSYGKYYGEILRTEGFNYFDVKDISTVSLNDLSTHKAVILSTMSLNQSQVDMFSSWVNGGGNLVAMHPDKKLADLLGLNDTGQSAINQYLRTNVATAAGMGIVDESIQYKGVADKYTLNGAVATATLYSDSSTPTIYPAATTRSVGKGTAMSFSYDLAQSVIGLHQGNQAWSGQDRDGDGIIRSNDLLFGQKIGDLQTDWLDVAKIDIPQADEQQRLLANMLTDAMKGSIPAPRFWYLPDNQKAELVLAGDDHVMPSDRGTEKILSNWLNESSTDCSVQDWQCIRASHYLYTSGPLTQSRALQYVGDGFEVANHPSNYNSCNNYASLSQLNIDFAVQLSDWRIKYPLLPYQNTSRYHCYLWSSWDMMPLGDFANGIRYDLGTVAYPSSWIGTHSPMITGSGMNMRLTDTNGSMIDVRQGVTNFDNTAVGPVSIAAAFDNALGSQGYYGIFGSHYDMSDTYNQTLYSIAKSRNVPIISAQQALTWLDGRNSSNFTNLTSLGIGKESFTINAAEGATGLQAMLPLSDAGGTLVSIESNGQPVSYQSSIIKGVGYAVFSARPGDYTVTYSDYSTSVTGVTNNTSVGSSPDQLVSSNSSAIGGSSALPDISSVDNNATPTPISVKNNPESSNNTAETTNQADNSILKVLGAVAVLIALGGITAGIWAAIARRRRQREQQ